MTKYSLPPRPASSRLSTPIYRRRRAGTLGASIRKSKARSRLASNYIRRMTYLPYRSDGQEARLCLLSFFLSFFLGPIGEETRTDWGGGVYEVVLVGIPRHQYFNDGHQSGLDPGWWLWHPSIFAIPTSFRYAHGTGGYGSLACPATDGNFFC